MVTTIKKGWSKAKIQSVFEKLSKSNRKGFDAHKFCGTVLFEKEGMKIQKQLRDEWK